MPASAIPPISKSCIVDGEDVVDCDGVLVSDGVLAADCETAGVDDILSFLESTAFGDSMLIWYDGANTRASVVLVFILVLVENCRESLY